MTPGCTREIVPAIHVLKITMDEKHMLIVKAKDWNVSEMPFFDLALLRKNLVAARFYLHLCDVRFQILPMFCFFQVSSAVTIPCTSQVSLYVEVQQLSIF